MCGMKGKDSDVCNNNGVNSTKKPSSLPVDHSTVINLDHGDPKMFGAYWERKEEECAITIKASELVSYFSTPGSICWFMQPEFGDVVKRLHGMVGNAVTEGRYVVVGTGSSQLYQAALYALASSEGNVEPVSVISGVPHYSSYQPLTDFLKSELYKWAGDANSYTSEEDKPYIEVVCSPNNPCGSLCKPVAKNCQGKKLLIHDLAYYWPQYTPITSPADEDIMLFTISKCTGHAGSRIGWAIVKDEAIARKMVKYIELSTIGTSKEAQIRATKIVNSICDDYLDFSAPDSERFFEFGYRVMDERWAKLREIVKCKEAFSLPEYPEKYCQFMGKCTRPNPAFAWMECKGVDDGAALLGEHKILARSGERFGADKKKVRVSMLDSDENVNVFLQRLSGI